MTRITLLGARSAICTIAATAALACSAIDNATAATVTLNATADLTLAGLTDSSIAAGVYFAETDALPLSSPVTVATGDTFVYNLDFLGNQQLTVEGLSIAWALVITQGFGEPSDISMTGTLELLGWDNSVVATATRTNTDGSIHIAQFFSGADFGSPASVTFAGFRYTGTVVAADVSPRTYDGPTMYFSGTSDTGEPTVMISEFTPVPEPGTWLLLALGLSALLIGTRGRRIAVAR